MFDFWGTFWSTVLALLCVAAVSTAAGFLARLLVRRVDTRPDFLLTRRQDGTWFLTRTRRSTAYDLAGGQGRMGVASNSPALALEALRNCSQPVSGDLSRGQTTAMPVGRDGEEHWFMWIDGGRRFSKSIELIGVGPIAVRRGRPTRDGRVSTS